MRHPVLLLLLACSAMMGEDAATFSAHIGGATRPEHLAALVERATDLPQDVRGKLIMRLGRLRMPDGLPLLERLLPLADETQAMAIIDHAIAMRHARAVPLLLAASRDARTTVQTHAWERMWYHPFTEDHAGDPLLRDALRACMAEAQHPRRVSAALILHDVGVGDEIKAAAEVILAVPPSTDRLRYIQRQILAERGDPRLFPLVLPDLRADFEAVGHNAQVNATRDIGKALQAGAPLDEETRRVLLHTIRVCPHPDPASFAAEALRDVRDSASYPVLLELLGHSEADEEIVQALCAIDPVRALADWRQLLRTAEESRLFSAILYADDHPALHPALRELIDQSPADLDEAMRARRREALNRLFWSNWPSEKQDADPAPHRAFLAAHLQDGDPEAARQAARWWSLQHAGDLSPDLVTRIRAWADHGTKQEREDAILMMSKHPAQFIPELAVLVRATSEFPQNHWLLRTGCEHGGIIPADELVDLVYAHHQKDRSESTTVEWYTLLFATRPGEDQAYELIFTPNGRSSEQRALMTRGAVRGIRALRLNSFIRRWGLLDEELRAAFVDAVATSEPDHARFKPLAARLTDYANTRDTTRMVAGLTALARHDLAVTPDDHIHDLISHGLAHLSEFWPEGEHSAWGEWKHKLLRITTSTGTSLLLTDSELHALLNPDQRQRGKACVMVQLEAAVGRLETYVTDPLRPHVFHIAATDVPGVRGEAARALAAMARTEDFARLAELFLADPVNRSHFAAALRASDAARAEEFLRTQRVPLRLDDALFATPSGAETTR